MSIAKNIALVRNKLREGISLVVVSKTRSIAEIMEAYQAGIRDFGENRVQELIKKAALLPTDIRWHLIGHLQSNKVKQAISAAFLIHSIDSIDLLREINREALKSEKVVNCLLQFHIAREQTKYGFSKDEIGKTIRRESLSQYRNIRILGVMGMATFTDDESIVRKEFQELVSIYTMLHKDVFEDSPDFTEISMGMSDDFVVAIEEGSTLVRVGTAIFGSRQA